MVTLASLACFALITAGLQYSQFESFSRVSVTSGLGGLLMIVAMLAMV